MDCTVEMTDSSAQSCECKIKSRLQKGCQMHLLLQLSSALVVSF